ncbi:MAG: hypothetical protein JW719_11485 [Pirellulales bacterium]|nr:hypothetical protein [Pirellulales bacterium]
MRLTLRTLLAYLDDILEPEDAEDISHRIQESEVASALMHRIRDVMRRLRLEAPQVEETRTGPDPNTVAEYLDHILPDDRVPDFERICLESDMHLAEVASCHQILALVLGEPAEVDPTSREHMYALPQVAAELEAMEAQASEEAGGDGRTGAAPPPTPRRPRPVVPDYLREPYGRRRPFPWITAAVVLVGMIAIGVMVARHAGWLGGSGKTIAQEDTPTGQPATSTAVPGESEEPGSAEPAVVEPPPEAQEQLDAEPMVAPTTPVPTLREPGAAAEPTGDVPPALNQPPGVNEVAPLPPAAAEGMESAIPADPGAQPDAIPSAQPVPAEPGGAEGGRTAPAAVDAPGAAQPAEPSKLPHLTGPPDAGRAEPDAEAPQHVGRFVSDAAERQLLLQWNPESRAWDRTPAQGILVSGSHLLSLPAFRPLVATTAGLMIQLRDGTQIGLETVEGEDVPRVALKYGRMVVNTVGKPEARLRLDLGDRSGTLVFVDPESRVAVEMTRALVAGSNPEKDPVEQVVILHVLSGRLVWESGDGAAPIELKIQSQLTLSPAGVEPVEDVEAFPKWIVSDTVASLDRSAAKALEEAVPVGRPVTLGLKELLDHRRIEVRRLAYRSLGYTGEFGPLVDGLNRAEQKPLWNWTDQIEELRDALARGPDVASQIRAALARAYGSDGPKLYRILWGYTPAQLTEGQDVELVKSLASDTLAMRVVSFWTLNKITALGLYYRPDDPPTKRQKAVNAWEKRLEDGEIRFKAARGRRSRPRGGPENGPSDEESAQPAADSSPPAGSSDQ